MSQIFSISRKLLLAGLAAPLVLFAMSASALEVGDKAPEFFAAWFGWQYL